MSSIQQLEKDYQAGNWGGLLSSLQVSTHC
jgi:hypothetical protein